MQAAISRAKENGKRRVGLNHQFLDFSTQLIELQNSKVLIERIIYNFYKIRLDQKFPLTYDLAQLS